MSTDPHTAAMDARTPLTELLVAGTHGMPTDTRDALTSALDALSAFQDLAFRDFMQKYDPSWTPKN